jgi:hypothetical protein
VSAPYQARMSGGDSSTNVELVQQLLAAAVESNTATLAKVREAAADLAGVRNRSHDLVGPSARPTTLAADAFMRIDAVAETLAKLSTDLEQTSDILNEIPNA